MKKYLLLLFISLSLGALNGHAQFTRYIIRLKDKGANPFTIANPSQYLTARSIQRRARYNILIDSSDLPVTPRYIDSIRLAGAVTILNVSKWLNQVAIQTSDMTALNKINGFPFVTSTNPIGALSNTSPVKKEFDVPNPTGTTPNPVPQNVNDYYSYGQSFGQVHLHNGEFLHNRGFRGQGMQMAILDAGFFHYLTLPTFDSVRNNGQVLGTWDFVSGNASVDEDHPHGMNCFSIIAANMPGVFMGGAPKASFYLYRTEDAATEYPIEEQNWAAGIERADSLGIDISSTSLGYFTFDNAVFNHTYADMSGHTTIIAKAANLAARKGIMVVVAAGNEGNSAWHYIITPGDGDSVMSLGAVSTSGVVGSFSSYGPNSSGQIKPDVAAVGVNATIANTTNGQPTFGSGTSFACPNMAGLTTCLMQAFPEVRNMGILSVMEAASNRSTNPDNRTGYGIPDLKKAFVMLIKQLYTQQVSFANCKATLQWAVKTDSVISVTVERKLFTDLNYLTVNTQTSTGGFAQRSFSYTDDMIAVPNSPVKFRFKMTIAADTSFYLDSLTVNFTPKPNLGANVNSATCTGIGFNLTTLFNTTGLTSSWTTGGVPVANPSNVTAPGVYQLIAVNNSGCGDTALVTLTNNPRPNLGADKAATKCSTTNFDLTTQFITTGLITNWTLAGATVATPAAVIAPGIYQLIATNGSGCSDTALITLANDPLLCTSAVTEKTEIKPNPVHGILTVSVIRTAAVKVDIALHNSGGQKVYELSNRQPAGGQTYPIPMQDMAGGIYYITIKVDDKKVIVKKILRK